MKITFTPLKALLFVGFIASFSCQQEEIPTSLETLKQINANGKSQNLRNGNGPEIVITVTDCDLNGWIQQPIGNSSLGFVNGPGMPAVGKGSLKFYVPAGGIFWLGDF